MGAPDRADVVETRRAPPPLPSGNTVNLGQSRRGRLVRFQGRADTGARRCKRVEARSSRKPRVPTATLLRHASRCFTMQDWHAEVERPEEEAEGHSPRSVSSVD